MSLHLNRPRSVPVYFKENGALCPRWHIWTLIADSVIAKKIRGRRGRWTEWIVQQELAWPALQTPKRKCTPASTSAYSYSMTQSRITTINLVRLPPPPNQCRTDIRRTPWHQVWPSLPLDSLQGGACRRWIGLLEKVLPPEEMMSKQWTTLDFFSCWWSDSKSSQFLYFIEWLVNLQILSTIVMILISLLNYFAIYSKKYITPGLTSISVYISLPLFQSD